MYKKGIEIQDQLRTNNNEGKLKLLKGVLKSTYEMIDQKITEAEPDTSSVFRPIDPAPGSDVEATGTATP